MDNSAFYRTIYIFSCLNAPCSSQSQAWLCIRTQFLEKSYEKEAKVMKPSEKIEWCTGADEWGDDDQLSDDLNSNEENGNVINNLNNKCDNRMSDEDDESNSFGSDPLSGFANLGIDDKNANCNAIQEGAGIAGACAIGGQVSPNRATAEIEGTESEVIIVDVPQAPQKDIMSLLASNQSMVNVSKDEVIQSFFISVDEEHVSGKEIIPEHVRELMLEYEMRDETPRTSPNDDPNLAAACIGVANMDDSEQYERGIPLHGDLIFHNFVTRIQENPGQIIRYSREAAPLLIRPLKDIIPKCQNCGGDVICEIQILPTLIPKMRFESSEPVPIDFGNVLIYTCMKSCWDTPDRMRVENVIVQQEADTTM